MNARDRKISALHEAAAFRKALIAWFRPRGADYPWRRTRDPYAVLVSEIMLQQTRVATVLAGRYYERFMEKFPDPQALAIASDEELLKSWEGLGYYRRARNLREAARILMANHGGCFPRNLQDIRALPGVGPYTAGAVASFAFDQASPAVDANIARVLLRLMDSREPVDGTGSSRAWEWAEALLDPEYPRDFNSALMELGQKICRPGVPDCASCPVARWCLASHPEKLPLRRRRLAISPLTEKLVFAVKDGRILLRRLDTPSRQGMWRLPVRRKLGPRLHSSSYTITRYRVTMEVYAPGGAVHRTRGEAWHDRSRLDHLSIPPADRRALAELLEWNHPTRGADE